MTGAAAVKAKPGITMQDRNKSGMTRLDAIKVLRAALLAYIRAQKRRIQFVSEILGRNEKAPRIAAAAPHNAILQGVHSLE